MHYHLHSQVVTMTYTCYWKAAKWPHVRHWTNCYPFLTAFMVPVNHSGNKAFTDIRLCPGIATPLATHCHMPTTAKHDVIHQNQNITYRNAANRESAQQISQRLVHWSQRYARGQSDTWTDRQTHRQTNWSQYSAPLPGRSNKPNPPGKDSVVLITQPLIHTHITIDNVQANNTMNTRF